MKNFLITYTHTNSSVHLSQKVRGRNVEEAQSIFSRVYPYTRIIKIKKIK
jgi:hypothetical protein